MAMTILNNDSTRMAHREMNQNFGNLDKVVKIIQTGQKINSAQDDASSYSISERMKVLVRDLNQTTQNVQNGMSLLKVAAGGIENIMDELKSLKEITINAMNDTNTDSDRAVLQKEFSQRVDTINDIAVSTKYNGLRVLGGAFAITRGVEVGATVVQQDDFDDLTKGFSVAYNGKIDNKTIKKIGDITYPLSSSFVNSSSGWSWTDEWTNAGNSNPYTTSTQTSQWAVNLDFSALTISGNIEDKLNGKGFAILCGACNQYINIKFDGSANTTFYDPNPSTTNRQAREFVIGIQGIQSLADLPKMIFDGIASTSRTTSTAVDPDTADNVLIDQSHQVRIAKDPNDPTKYLLLKNADRYAMQFVGKGTIDASGELVSADDTPVLDSYEEPEDTRPKIFNPLKIQHGASAGQSMNFHISEMTTKFLRTRIGNDKDKEYLSTLLYDPAKYLNYENILREAKGKNLDDARVETINQAKVAMRLVEGAIEFAENEATNVGSYMQRLEYTENNINTMSENIQAADSKIRDADMARAMTEYAKTNLLSQSSQAMLAQANQNSKNVVSLLQ